MAEARRSSRPKVNQVRRVRPSMWGLMTSGHTLSAIGAYNSLAITLQPRMTYPRYAIKKLLQPPSVLGPWRAGSRIEMGERDRNMASPMYGRRYTLISNSRPIEHPCHLRPYSFGLREWKTAGSSPFLIPHRRPGLQVNSSGGTKSGEDPDMGLGLPLPTASSDVRDPGLSFPRSPPRSADAQGRL